MTLVQGTLPYDVDQLLAGAARVIISDDALALPAIPANVSDVIDCKTPYAPKTGWVDIGSTTDATSYTRDLTVQEYTIEQTQAAVFEDVTEVSRSIRVAMGEIKQPHLVILEGEGTSGTVAAVAGQSVAQKSVKFGSVTNLKKRRVCFIGQRNILSGGVTETVGAINRGRFVLLCLYSTLISADAAEIQLGKGNLVSGPVTFKAYPEGGQASGKEFGTWLLEDPGTI